METEPSDNAEGTEKSMNAIRADEISIKTLTEEAAKGEAAKSSLLTLI